MEVIVMLSVFLTAVVANELIVDDNVRIVNVEVSLSFVLFQTANLDSSRLKEFEDDNFKFEKKKKKKDWRKVYRRVENTVGKEKLFVSSKFTFSIVFLKTCIVDR